MADEAPSLSDGPALSAGAAARRLGVAVATLRSWDRRYGLGPSGHEAGAHRRYAPADMARLEAMCRLVGEGAPVAEAARVVLDQAERAARDPAAPHGVTHSVTHAATRTATDTATRPAPRAPEAPTGRRGGGTTLPIGRRGASTARGLARAAIRLDAPQVLALVEETLARDGIAAAWQETLEPALRAVGRKWTEHDGRYVEVEHMISWCVTAAVHRMLPVETTPAWSQGRGVLLACAPGEWHSLPLEVLNLALLERAIPTRMLGAAVPPDALCEAVRRLAPAHIVLWSHVAHTADNVLLARLAKQRSSALSGLLAAGPGWMNPPAGVIRLMSLPQAIGACDPDEATRQRHRTP